MMTEDFTSMCFSFILEPVVDYSEIKIVIPTLVKLVLVENYPENSQFILLFLARLLETFPHVCLPTDYLDT